MAPHRRKTSDVRSRARLSQDWRLSSPLSSILYAPCQYAWTGSRFVLSRKMLKTSTPRIRSIFNFAMQYILYTEEKCAHTVNTNWHSINYVAKLKGWSVVLYYIELLFNYQNYWVSSNNNNFSDNIINNFLDNIIKTFCPFPLRYAPIFIKLLLNIHRILLSSIIGYYGYIEAYYIIVLRYTPRAHNVISHLVTATRQSLIDASWEIQIIIFHSHRS